MLVILMKALPLFLLVALGYFCKKVGFLKAEAIKNLSRFVMFFALPSVLLTKLATTEFEALFDLPFLVGYLSSLVLVMTLTAIFSYIVIAKEKKTSLMVGVGGVYGNIGFMAIPLLSVTVGEWVSVPLALMLTLDLLILLPASTFLLQLSSPSRSNTTAWYTFQKSLVNPLILSILLGLVISMSDLNLPSHLLDGLDWLAKTAGPCAMFIVGTALYGRELNEKRLIVYFISIVKLLVMPLAVFIIMNMLKIDPMWIMVATLGAAMPCAAVLGVIAEDNEAIPQQASAAVLVTSVLSVFSIPFLVSYLN